MVSLPLFLALPGLLAAAGNPAADDDRPTIDKDSIRITLQGGSQRAYVKPGWVPHIEYRVNGPIAGGSQLSVEFTLPGKAPWVKFDCQTGETEKGHVWKVGCGGDDISNDKAVVLSGPVGFTIRLRNELTGTNTALFTGTMKIGRVPGTSGANASDDYYVDDDWRIPFGYVFIGGPESQEAKSLHVGFWYRGNPPEIEAHLYYQGKDVAKFNAAGNGPRDWNPAKYQWGFANCEFLGVYSTQEAADEGYDPKLGLDKNPGEYEVKALVANHLARSIKFTVGADGKFDNGIATANKLGSNRVIVPVQVIGNQGTWDKTAWKAGAFYGNPLTGFTPAP
jgi:hypothetical protein